MADALRALVLEDNPDDAELVILELERGGFNVTSRRVETGEAMVEALAADGWDVVLSDYAMPGFNALEALQILRGRGLDLPFIIISGTIGEETAVATMRAGATDYVLKDNLARLTSAVRRELAEAKSRAARRTAETALRRTEDYNRALLEAIPDVIFRIARDGHYLDFVGGLEPRFHGLPESFLGQHLDAVLPRDLASQYMGAIELALDDGEVALLSYQLDEPDGVHAYETRITGCGPNEVVAIARDVTQDRKLEVQLRAGQRMEAVGRVAGGIAHDFNNVLMAINSYVHLVRETLAEDHPARSDLGSILHAAGRAAALTRQLLAFSRQQIQRLVVLDIGRVVAEMSGMLKRVITEQIEIVIHRPDDLGCVRADPSQVEQIVMNLVVNAGDAMPDGGTLLLETSNVDLEDDYVDTKPAPVPAGAYVMLAVSDNGVGMDEETRTHAFEPFFSTKPRERGTGLGLSTVYGIVKQSGGFVWVYSEPGAGSTFKIYLPRVDAEETIAPQPELARPPRGNETVLLVEDDDLVRNATRRILERGGYRVLEADGPNAALTVAGEQTESIDLLITDVVMPDLSGKELAQKLQATSPTLPVIYMSGYTDNAIVHHGVLDHGTVFLQKPFSADSLLRIVRSTLDE